MIPQAFITEWQSRVPWPEPYQIEQDLILSRLMIEIAQNEFLKNEFVLRGGTCLHKLHLNTPRRYSEDLDYVRRSSGAIGPYLDVLRELAARVGLTVSNVDSGGPMVRMLLDAEATGGGRIRIKVETTIAETDFYKEAIEIEHRIDSRWWSGNAGIPTFTLDEMMSTKLRALYQRRKGRDVFDLWLLFRPEGHVNSAEIATGLRHYMQDGVHVSAASAQSGRQPFQRRFSHRP